jgi:hypothetical protein
VKRLSCAGGRWFHQTVFSPENLEEWILESS